MDEINKLQEMTDRLLGEAKKSKKSKNAEKADVPDVQPRAYSYSEAFDFSQPLGALNLYRSQGVVNFGPFTGVGPYIDDNPHRIKHDSHEMQSAWETLSRKAGSGIVAEGAWGKVQALVEGPGMPPAPAPQAQVQKAPQVSPKSLAKTMQAVASDPKKLGMMKHMFPKEKSIVYMVQSINDTKQGMGSPEEIAKGLMDYMKSHPQSNQKGSYEYLVQLAQSMGEDYSAAHEDIDEKHIGFKKLKGKLSHEKGVKDPGALAAAIGRNKYGAAGMAKKSAAGRK